MKKLGKPKDIESPERLLEYFEQYKAWAKSNPYKVHDFVGKDAIEVHKEKERPITFIGFEGWLSMNKITSQLKHYELNTNGSYTDYLPIIAHIKAQTSADIVDGAMAGIYNANLAARLQGLVDKSDITSDGEKIAQNVIIDWGKGNTPTGEQ